MTDHAELFMRNSRTAGEQEFEQIVTICCNLFSSAFRFRLPKNEEGIRIYTERKSREYPRNNPVDEGRTKFAATSNSVWNDSYFDLPFQHLSKASLRTQGRRFLW
jgi:hypothetical protein